jgi:Flp pilus assembly secretin CpaC
MPRRHANITLATTLGAILGAAAVFTAASTAYADQISVEMDKARTLRLAAPVATVIVGNPLIADASVLDRQTLVINGKSYGQTNLIAIDADGAIIYSTDLVVTEANSPQTALVSLYRGAARSSFACAGGGVCQSQAMIGDAADVYSTVTDQRSQQLDASNAAATANE